MSIGGFIAGIAGTWLSIRSAPNSKRLFRSLLDIYTLQYGFSKFNREALQSGLAYIVATYILAGDGK
jgi:hypothetical protein